LTNERAKRGQRDWPIREDTTLLKPVTDGHLEMAPEQPEETPDISAKLNKQILVYHGLGCK
jgi:hypothetical protein